MSTCCCSCLCINTNKSDDEKILIVIIAGNSFSKGIRSTVGQTVKASHETCDNCLRYGNKTNPSVGKEANPKTTFLI